MAAIQPNLAFAPSRSTTPESTSAGPIAGRIASAAVAIACIGVGLAMGAAYPILPLLAMGLFLAWAVIATLRPALGIPAMLALLPVVGFATRTGWLTFEEMDFMVLASAAGGYAAFAFTGQPAVDRGERRFMPQLSIFSVALLLVFFVSQTISLVRGIGAGGGFRFDWFQSYFEPLNSLRVYRSFSWVLLLTPLVLRESRKPGFFDRVSVAMTIALGLCSVVVFQERLAFTGLLEFSEDYRATGPFWENHVGGVALEGFLAIAIPFAVREALRPARTRVDWGRVIASSAVLIGAGYACFVTFTRGLYIAVPVALMLIVVLAGRQHRRSGIVGSRPSLLYCALLALLAGAGAFVVFRHGGYRTVLALLVAIVFALPVEASLRRSSIGMRLTALVAALLFGVLAFLGEFAIPKGSYLMFAVAAVATGAALMRAERGPTRATEITAIAGWLGMVICACSVAWHWGGAGALRDCAVVGVALIALSFTTVFLRRPLHPTRRQGQLVAGAFIALLMGSVAVFNAGSYAGGRLDTSSGDLSVRLAHWRAGIDRLRSADDWMFGKGLGRFPSTSLLEIMDIPTPGSYAFVQRDGESFVRITAPRLRYISSDELFRFSQRISVRPRTKYRVLAHVRAAQASTLHFEICEKQLIYPGDCVVADRGIQGQANEWQLLDFTLETGHIGVANWYAPKPVFFAIGPYERGASVDVRLIRMIGPDGVDVLSNGDFSNRTEYWFSSSDKYHLPWRIENLYLDVLFGQGILGLVAFSLLVVAALLRTTFGRAARHADAPYVAAAISGALVVGLFDSLTDAPRIALLFWLVVLLGLILRNPRAAAPTARTRAEAPVSQAVSGRPSRARRGCR